MNELIKKHGVLILAFALPVILIVVVAILAYAPSRKVQTQYDFVYTTCLDSNNYYYTYNCSTYSSLLYSVVDDALVVKEVSDPQTDNTSYEKRTPPTIRIFLHDTETNLSKEISLKDAQSLKLSGLITSPDGVVVSNQYERTPDMVYIFGGGHSTYEYYLMKGNSKSRLNLINNGDYYNYQNSFKFLGWVLTK
jgi:hypothetical protein